MTTFTCIYSSECIEPAKRLVDAFLSTFDCAKGMTFDDMFYYGVFCKPETYANYDDFESLDIEEDDYIKALVSPCVSESERIEIVQTLIAKIMRKEDIKPEWMVQIEATTVCGDYEMAPSTFLYLECKDPQFQGIADAMIKYLYSPNLMITMVEE